MKERREQGFSRRSLGDMAMEIICKCGHSIENHSQNCGCWETFEIEKRAYICDCTLSCYDVAKIFATEQQARLDTNRAQVEALIAERDALDEKLGYSQRENCELRKERENHAVVKAQLNYVLADNAQLRAVLVQVLEYLDDASGGTRSFPETLKNLKMSLNIMGDPRENHG